MKYLRILFSAAALLLAASCIENDIPYPTIELNIRSIEGEGFTVAGISLVNRTVTSPSTRRNSTSPHPTR